MGATTFESVAVGTTAEEAFREARDEALYMNGHGGYTGTLVEKPGFQVFRLKSEDPTTARDAMQAIGDMNVEDVRELLAAPEQAERAIAVYEDKWAEAVCLPMGDGRFLFGGWASW